jgi:tetratricopeptide (TPR) repeat protein
MDDCQATGQKSEKKISSVNSDPSSSSDDESRHPLDPSLPHSTQLCGPYIPILPRPPQVHGLIGDINSLGENPDRPGILYTISNQSQLKYRQSNADVDLSLGFEMGYMAITSLDLGDPRLPAFLHNYARAVQCVWEKTQESQSLDHMVEYYERALKAAPERHPLIGMYLCDVGYALHSRFSVRHSLDDLLAAKDYYIQSLAQTHNVSTKAIFSNNLVAALRDEFDALGREEILDEAINIQENAIDSLPDKDPTVANRIIYRNLGLLYTRRFQRKHDGNDIDKALLSLLRAREPPQPNPNDAEWSGELARAYELRFYQSGSISDADEAVSLYRTALAVRVNVLNLANVICVRAQRTTYSIDEIDEAIRILRTAVEGHRNDNELLNALGGTLFVKFERTGDLKCLEEAMYCYTEAATDENDSDRSTYFSNLGTALLSKFDHQVGTMEDLLQAIEAFEVACGIATSLDVSPNSNIINGLGKAYKTMYHRTDSLSDLDTAIQYFESSASDEPLHKNDYANALTLRSDATGSMEDLHKATELYESAFQTAHGSDRAMYQTGLANSLQKRHQWTGSLNDLNSAVSHYRNAVDSTLSGHPSYGPRLHNLAGALLKHYAEHGDVGELKDAVKLMETAVETAHQRRAIATFNSSLGGAYIRMFQKSEDLLDIQKAVEALKKAEEAAEDPGLLYVAVANLGVAYSSRAQHTKLRVDRDDAIDTTKRALKILKDDIRRADLLMNLGQEFHTLFLEHHSEAGREAIECYEEAFRTVLARPTTRISAAIAAAEIREAIDPTMKEAADLLTQAIELLPMITLDLQSSDQFHLLRKYHKLAPFATAMALEADFPAEKAFRLFEIGRGLLLGHLLDSRAEISALKDNHSELAERLIRAHKVLYSDTTTQDVFRVQRKRAAAEYGQTVAEIRKLEEFHDFLQLPDSAQLAKRNITWPIVAINIHRLRSDALIIRNTVITSLQLCINIEDVVKYGSWTRFSMDLLEGNESEAHQRFEHAMKWLWDCVAEPVLRHLGYCDTPKSDWPRVHWILGGLANLFPIHAAGDFQSPRSAASTVLDRIISSYSPTLKALIHAYDRASNLDSASGLESSAMIVCMEHTPGLLEKKQLINALAECNSVQRGLQNITSEIILNPTRDEVLSGLTRCSIVHFACHGVSDQGDPSKNKLLLRDWRQRPLNFRILSKTEFSRCRLAYLSACGSAENKNLELSDESVHLVGGFQIANVPTVIGTSWKIDDSESATVVERFYADLLEDADIDIRRASKALHKAVRHQRDNGARPLIWGATIYYGV